MQTRKTNIPISNQKRSLGGVSPRKLGALAIVVGCTGLHAARAETPPSSPAYQEGIADRVVWENWQRSLTGDYKAGAAFWAIHRSQKPPPGCPTTGDVAAGCAAARSRLAVIDARRLSEPDYRVGFNTYSGPSSPPLSDNVQTPPPPAAPSPPPGQTTAAPVAAVPSVSSPPPPPTPPAAVNAIEPTIAQWHGAGTTQTRPFHVDGPWELQWTRRSGHFSAWLHAVGRPDETHLLANGSNDAGNSYYVPTGGDYYFEFDGSDEWTARVVALSPSPANASNTTAPLRPAPPAPIDAPTQDQPAFIAAIKAARVEYRNAANQLAQGAARPHRARAICQAVSSPNVQGWLGRIATLTTNGEGKGVLLVTLGDDIEVGTWNNAFSDIGDHTLIDPNSPLFQTLATLRPGTSVRFSGSFVTSATDCFHERSVTMDGSIGEPEFVFRFSQVEELR